MRISQALDALGIPGADRLNLHEKYDHPFLSQLVNTLLDGINHEVEPAK
jgi:hypothetical protein